jgi:hypothetical protein
VGWSGRKLSDTHTPLEKETKKEKRSIAKKPKKNDAGKDRALATELSSAKRLDQQDLDREPKEAKQ